jgi:hypothetical protein
MKKTRSKKSHDTVPLSKGNAIKSVPITAKTTATAGMLAIQGLQAKPGMPATAGKPHQDCQHQQKQV